MHTQTCFFLITVLRQHIENCLVVCRATPVKLPSSARVLLHLLLLWHCSPLKQRLLLLVTMHILVRKISSSNPCPASEQGRSSQWHLGICEVGGRNPCIHSRADEASSRAENTNTWAPGPVKIWWGWGRLSVVAPIPLALNKSLSKTQTLGDKVKPAHKCRPKLSGPGHVPNQDVNYCYNWEELRSPRASAPAPQPLTLPPRGRWQLPFIPSSDSSHLCCSPTSHPRWEDVHFGSSCPTKDTGHTQTA